MKLVLTILFLLCTAHAWALNYTATTLIDLTTLRFTGVAVTVTPWRQFQDAGVVTSDGVVVNNGLAFEGIDSWPDHLSSVVAPGTGSAEVRFDATQLSVTASLLEAGSAGAIAWRSALLSPSEAGLLTISANYLTTRSGIPMAAPGMEFGGGPSLWVGDAAGDTFDYRIRPDVLGEAAQERGLLSVTRAVRPGDWLAFSVEARRGASVPEPSAFWLLAAGLMGWIGWRSVR